MSGPNSPEGPESEDTPDVEPVDGASTAEYDADDLGDSEFPSQAYSAPESEQFLSAPYIPADPHLYDYDSYEGGRESDDGAHPPRWPWVVGVTAIIAAIALVVSVSLLVTRTDTETLATPQSTTTAAPPVQDEITTTVPPPPPPPPPPSSEEPPPPPPPPPSSEEPPPPAPEPPPPPPSEEPPPTTTTEPPPTTTTTTKPAGPRQITYSVTGTKAPGDIISVTYVDASGRRRTQRNVYIPWSLTITPISTSEVGSVQASSLFLVSKLNCSITTSDGETLSSNDGNAATTSC